jgi:hypothetical protein
MSDIVSVETIAGKIYLIRGTKVMLDRDLAELYGVETKALKQAVRRNIKRFPHDFMFELTKEELKNWRSQFVTSNSIKMGLRHSPMAFTEQGVAMLSSVLKSDRAVEVNIQIIRVFVKLRQLFLDNEELRKELEELKQITDERFQIVFEIFEQFFWKYALNLAIQLTQLHDNPFIPNPSAFHISGCSLHKEISLLCFFIASMIVLNILTLKFLGYRSFFPSLTRLLLTFNKADSGNLA